MENPTRKKVSRKAIIGIILGIAVAIAVKILVFKTPSHEAQLQQAASNLNKSCPMMIDPETRLDTVTIPAVRVFQYNYTLVNMKKASVDMEDLKNFLTPTIVENVKTSPQLQLFREQNTTLSYRYNDLDGVFLFDIVVTPDLYKTQP
ncbi:hypothetical protein ACFQ21_03065 [Ohtaekwangia kribbensis]|uniref:Uncharacterized protein n=1 Tax=Ohtaekwangia kribbensis TaxID=688913 RepID=A0ABW3JYL3_9BACT